MRRERPTGQALDLATPETDPWASLDVPAGWERVAEVCRRLGRRLPAFSQEVADAVDAELPEYLGEGGVDREDLVMSIERNFEMTLIGMAERRGPTDTELQIRRELGRRRALQGRPIDMLLRAYHIGFRELWRALVESAEDVDPETATRLLRASGTAWQWVHEVTSAVSDAHVAVERRRTRLVAGLHQRFLEMLLAADADARELVDVALTLGFQPDGVFQAAAALPSDLHEDVVARAEDALEREGVVGLCAARASAWVLLVQASAEVLERLVLELFDGDPSGIGMAREGLAGARVTVGDADRALELARRRGGTVRFATDWPAITVAQMQDRLAPVLGAGVEVARGNRTLADTVVAFAEAGFSVAGAARRLEVHPNTVTYRLGRWSELTGWDPQSWPGLASSLAAVELSR